MRKMQGYIEEGMVEHVEIENFTKVAFRIVLDRIWRHKKKILLVFSFGS